MKRQLLGLIAAALLSTGLTAPAPGQAGRPRSVGPAPPQTEAQRPSPARPGEDPGPDPDGETIKVDTTLVTIPVSVIDRDGKYIPHLAKRDFRLFEDGVEQEVSDFTAVEEPFSVVLLLDTSRSTIFKIEDIQRAAVAFVEQLHARDRVMVVSFDQEVYIDCEFTSDRGRLRRAIYGTRTGGATKLYDAVDLAISERLDRIEGRKAIVLFTDGVDTASRLASARSTLERVEESNVLVYPIQYDTEGDARNPTIFGGGRGGRRSPSIIDIWPFPRGGGSRRWPFDSPFSAQFPRGGGGAGDYTRGSRYLGELAERSGARLHHADTLGNLERAFSLIADELRHQYALSYYPTNAARDGAYRRVRVRVERPNVLVRARDGYRAEGGAQAREDKSSPDGRERPALKRGRPLADGH